MSLLQSGKVLWVYGSPKALSARLLQLQQPQWCEGALVLYLSWVHLMWVEGRGQQQIHREEGRN